jgi:hypothetical protein
MEDGHVDSCIKVSGVPNSNGDVFTAEALEKLAAENDDYWIKRKPDGRVELWAKVEFPAKPLSSKEEG